jgi:hypothetical protein
MKNKVVSVRSPRSGTSSRNIELGFFGHLAGLSLFELESFIRAENPLTADILVCSVAGAPEALSENRGTPVIIVDESDAPAISSQLLSLLRHPEVKVCLRKYGYRDTASYFRGSDYYERASERGRIQDLPPDHFPVYDDDPVGNAIRKIQVKLPTLDLDDCQTPTDRLALSARPQDVVYLSELSGDVTESFRNTRVVVSTTTFSELDFLAVLHGCVLVKPECSNVYSLVDIYDPMKRYTQFCDIALKDLTAVVDYVLQNIEEYGVDSLSLFTCWTTERWKAQLRKTCKSVRLGKSRLGDTVCVTPMV